MTELICIGCPIGCRIEVEQTKEKLKISGYGCERGKEYAKDETVSPKRVLTGIVKVKGRSNMVSVKTAGPIPKEKIVQAFSEIKSLVVEAPVMIGQIVKENVAQTGVSLVATKNIEKKHPNQGI